MSGFLLDTSILSAVAPDRPPLPSQAEALLRGATEQLYIPALAIQEIRKGIRKLDRSGGHERAERLLAWLFGIMESYGDRVLSIDASVAIAAGILEDEVIEAGRSPGLADILIAATAMVHGLTVLTANERHFRTLGVEVRNPLTV